MVKRRLTDGELGWLVGYLVGFIGGAALVLAICLTWGNAFPEPW